MGRSTDQWRLKTGECSEAKASRLKAEAVARAIDESWRVTGRERRRDPPGTAEATEWRPPRQARINGYAPAGKAQLLFYQQHAQRAGRARLFVSPSVPLLSHLE